jgi:hypothetical protein
MDGQITGCVLVSVAVKREMWDVYLRHCSLRSTILSTPVLYEYLIPRTVWGMDVVTAPSRSSGSTRSGTIATSFSELRKSLAAMCGSNNEQRTKQRRAHLLRLVRMKYIS